MVHRTVPVPWSCFTSLGKLPHFPNQVNCWRSQWGLFWGTSEPGTPPENRENYTRVISRAKEIVVQDGTANWRDCRRWRWRGYGSDGAPHCLRSSDDFCPATTAVKSRRRGRRRLLDGIGIGRVILSNTGARTISSCRPLDKPGGPRFGYRRHDNRLILWRLWKSTGLDIYIGGKGYTRVTRGWIEHTARR